MTQRQKLLEQMRNSPGNIRFGQVEALLKHEGFVLFNQRGATVPTTARTDAF